MMEKDTRLFIHSMQQTISSDLKDNIIATLTDIKSEIWFPHLTHSLVQNGLQNLYDKTGITEVNYGTARVILNDVTVSRFVETFVSIDIDCEEVEDIGVIEMLPTSIIQQYKDLGIDFYIREELQKNTDIIYCLRDAFETIRLIPSLFVTVRCLVKCIHLIKLEDDEYDVSFSEPHVPFSIFVSVCKENTHINALRVAEAIVHEAMHLQLTLIENVIPLIVQEKELVYSPWREEYRPSQGVLHAIYVFKIISDFMKKISTTSQNYEVSWRNYLNSRISQIQEQFSGLEFVENRFDLTPNGIIFAEKILSKDVS